MILKDRMLRGNPIWKRIVDRAFSPSKNKGFIMAQAVSGGAAGNLTVSKIKKNDHLVAVIAMRGTVDGAGDLTSQFRIVSDGVINNTGGTATTSMMVLVIWEAFDEE